MARLKAGFWVSAFLTLATAVPLFGQTPTISQVTPNFAGAGATIDQEITVTGTNFASGAVVVFGSIDLATTFGSATSVTAVIPVAQLAVPGTVDVTVRNPAPGNEVSNVLPFTIVGVPTAALLNPDTAEAGSASFALTVTGTNFVAASVVLFDGAPLSPSASSATELTVTVPSTSIATAGPKSVVVRNPGNLDSNTLTFTVTPAPVAPALTVLNPNTAEAGSASFALTVTGTNFVAASVVLFDGAPLSPSASSATELTVTVPAASIATAGPKSVVVRNPGNLDSNTLTFTVTPAPVPPTLTVLNPDTAEAGSASFALTVTGTNFVAASVVLFDGAPLSPSASSATELTVTVPAASIATAGPKSVVVRNPGNLDSNTLTFTVTPAPVPPTLTVLNPNTAEAGSASFALTVTGTNFVAASVVLFDGEPLSPSASSATELTVTVPAASIATAGPKSVVVRNPGNLDSNALTFTVTVPPPTITQLNPNSAPAGSGEIPAMIVTGTGFVNGAVVVFGSTGLATTFVSGTELRAVVPAGLLAAPGQVLVSVRNPDSQVSLTLTFNINAVIPTLDSISPTEAIAGAADTPMTLSGNNFQSGAVVLFGSAQLARQRDCDNNLCSRPVGESVYSGACKRTGEQPRRCSFAGTAIYRSHPAHSELPASGGGHARRRSFPRESHGFRGNRTTDLLAGKRHTPRGIVSQRIHWRNRGNTYGGWDLHSQGSGAG
ncbi:MAG: hypothetical protein U5J83_18115 [Bryobacterales bacterium]|nr:hypothetical protein [Bryobacterales bacterium]